MKILQMTGSVPENSVLPRWNDVFPALIDPAKVLVQDGFGGSGAILARNFEYSRVAVPAWAAASADLTVSDGAVGAINNGERVAVFDLPESAFPNEIYARLQWNGSAGAVGIIARYNSINSHVRALILGSGSVALQFDDGSTNTVASAAFSPVVGQEYDMRMTLQGNQISVYVDDVVHLSAEVTYMASVARAGIYFLQAELNPHRIKEFAVA